MSNRDKSLYIIDILIASDKICRYTDPFDNADDFMHSELEWDAVIRELQLIGDATNILIDECVLDHSYRRIVDFRNQIVHGYFGIDHNIVWSVVNQKIPELVDDIMAISENCDTSQAIESALIENSYNKAVVDYLEKLKKACECGRK